MAPATMLRVRPAGGAAAHIGTPAQQVLRTSPSTAPHASVQSRVSTVCLSSAEALPSTSRPSASTSLFKGANKSAVQRLRRSRGQRSDSLGSSIVVQAAAAAVAPGAAAMKTVEVPLGDDRTYPIYIGAGLLDRSPELLRKHIPGKKVLIVTNETIAPLYLEK